MATFAPPTPTPKAKAADRPRPRPAAAPRSPWLGAAQLEASHRTLSGGPIQRLAAGARSPWLDAAAQLEANHRTLSGAPIQRLAAPAKPAGGLFGRIAKGVAGLFEPAPKPANRTGLPDRLKAGVEAQSGLAMDDVRVHRNSPEPAKLGALAYTQGSDIHLGPGQDQHLPHEAWHVVQQKQGRVKATTQLKGMGVNEDAGLEAEADRMAGSIESSIGTERRAPTPQHTGKGTVIQRKVVFKGAPFKDPGVSKTLSDLCTSPQTFMLRDDWLPSHSTIHVLENKKYLLGDNHAQTRWPKDTELWSFVPKMMESLPAIPGTNLYYARKVFKDTEGNPAPVKGTDKPLESSHVHMLNVLILSHEILNDISCEEGRNSDRVLEGKGDLLIGYLDNVYYIMGEYKWFCSLAGIKSSKLEHFMLLCKFTGKLSSAYIKELRKIAFVTSFLMDELKGSGDYLKIKEYYRLLGDYRKVIPLMIADMTKIVGLKEGGVEEGRVKTVIASSQPDQEQAGGAIRVTREIGMAAAIKAHQPPLLVELGDSHVEGVAKYAKDPTIVKLHFGEEFEGVTGKPK